MSPIVLLWHRENSDALFWCLWCEENWYCSMECRRTVSFFLSFRLMMCYGSLTVGYDCVGLRGGSGSGGEKIKPIRFKNGKEKWNTNGSFYPARRTAGDYVTTSTRGAMSFRETFLECHRSTVGEEKSNDKSADKLDFAEKWSCCVWENRICDWSGLSCRKLYRKKNGILTRLYDFCEDLSCKTQAKIVTKVVQSSHRFGWLFC